MALFLKTLQEFGTMLTEILKILRANGPMSLAELARHFQTDVSVMQGMLEILERKQRIQRLETKCSRCKGCIEMKPEDAAIFQALDSKRSERGLATER
jgi:DNA-binding MarR family transcriptional regulator